MNDVTDAIARTVYQRDNAAQNTDLAEVTDALRAHVRRASDLLWALDSATSLRRKAEQGGYRSSGVTGDRLWDAGEYRRREAAAVLDAWRYLQTLKPAELGNLYLNDYEERATIKETFAANRGEDIEPLYLDADAETLRDANGLAAARLVKDF